MDALKGYIKSSNHGENQPGLKGSAIGEIELVEHSAEAVVAESRDGP